MNFKDIQDYLIERTRNHTTVRLDNIKKVINVAMRTVSRQKERSWLVKFVSKTLVTGQYSGYVLDDQDIDQILRMSIPAEGIVMTELPYENLIEAFPASSIGQDSPEYFAIEQQLGVKAQPSAASVVTFASSSTTDTTQIMRIVGISNSVRQQEEVTLTGTSLALSVKTFTEIFSIEKSARTIGKVTATSNAAAVTLTVIPPDALGSMYFYFSIRAIPDSAYVLSIKCRKIIHPMVDDRDVPGDIYDEEFQDAILATAEAIILKDPTMAGLTLKTDKGKSIIKGSVGMRNVDNRAWRDNLEMGRYRGS